MRIGINGSSLVAAGRPVGELVAHAAQAEADGFATSWIAQLGAPDALTALAVIGQATSTIELGTAVIATWPRHPLMLAAQALTTAQLCPDRLVVGIGLAHKPTVEATFRIPFARPAQHMDEYLSILLPAMAHQPVDVTGATWSANAAGMSNAMTLELAKVFGYDIDFAQDLRVGDRFYVVYDEVYRDGERVSSGDILAAAFVNQGREFSAFRYRFADGRDAYFDREGRPMKKSFLRMPIEFARISSRFSTARKHPILGKVRAHKGVDYAARSGTPIMSAGDGRIAFAGWKSGYGRCVIVDHGRGYTTLYGHMSKFGKYRTGGRVRQGDTIGYVGMTGLATAPHLHYEFRVKGVHQNPLTVTMPKPEPLPKSELARFNAQTSPMMAQLALLSADKPLALLKR